jgi:hypothetical protein
MRHAHLVDPERTAQAGRENRTGKLQRDGLAVLDPTRYEQSRDGGWEQSHDHLVFAMIDARQ